ncbi:unnamed protein product [Anisakis simplex]|uniref:M20/M25/M40 family metallo-hydrolase n=1 Tax=Anisakis simplex TaxID=6269 RepID=A0A0M3JCG3_ANISI|nr:unnamed protein product [Anisakis simplex]
MESVGIKSEAIAIGMQEMLSGDRIDLPPIIVGGTRKLADKKTLLVYGYFDVQSAGDKANWRTDPFKLAEKDGRLYGRGVVDNKAAVMAWIAAIEILQKQNVELPLNVKQKLFISDFSTLITNRHNPYYLLI